MVVQTPVANILNNITSPATQDNAKHVAKRSTTNEPNRAREGGREREKEKGRKRKRKKEREKANINITVYCNVMYVYRE